jgi:hypothetical protein
MTTKKDIFYPFIIILSYINTFLLITYQRLRIKDFNSNKNIIINLWGEVFRIPLNHRLPLYSYLYNNYSTNLRGVSSYIGNKYKRFTAIDVGANVGDSAILIRQGSNSKIVCIEGDRVYVDILKLNLNDKPGIKIYNLFVGEKKSNLNGILNRKEGTGYLNIGKSDGFDGKIIRGSKKIISESKPIIFFEFYESMYASVGDSTYEVIKYLYKMGYKSFLIYDNFGTLLRSLRMKSNVNKHSFNKIFNYEGNSYYDLVAFHNVDLGLYDYSLENEIEFFKK